MGLRDGIRAALHLNVLLALSASSLVAASALIGGHEIPLAGVVAAFTATFAVYNFDRLADATEGDGSTSPQRDALMRRIRGPLVVGVGIATLVTLVLASISTWDGALLVLAFPLSGLLYIAPIFAGRRLKDIPYLKSFYVPACWCVFIGQSAALGAFEFDVSLAVFTVFFYLRMFAGCAIGDLRDLELDRAAGVRTFAVALGHARGRWVIEAAHALSLPCIVLAAVFGLAPIGAVWLVVPAVFGYACFRRFLANPSDSELVLELYDLEVTAYAPLLWLVL